MALPVRTLVLFKHGVGYFVREGRVDGTTVSLAFRQDEINDVLKSLTVIDRSGGHVLGVDYQTPMDTADRWANTSIRMSTDASLRTLLTDLRGRRVTLGLPQGPRTGRVVGLDLTPGPAPRGEAPPRDRATVSLLQDDGRVTVWPLADVGELRIDDEQARADLDYSLDTTASDGHRRTVHIRLSEGEHDLVAHYVAPSPVWRVSYRVVADTEGERGTALIQAWGLFDNRLDEDLEEVQLVLIAGQPVSFVYDLYASRIPERPVVHEQNRMAAGPIEYETAAPPAPAAAGGRRGDFYSDADGVDGAAGYAWDETDPLLAKVAAPAPMAFARQSLEAATPAVSEGRDAGEFFQYVIGSPVSVRRGDSALVPILNATTPYERELLFNPEKYKRHPVAALRLTNDSGMTFERGPATLVEDGNYVGDAIVPFTKAGAELYLPFAIELGVTVTSTTSSRRETHGLRFQRQYVLIDDYTIATTEYTLSNDTGTDRLVTIEAPIDHTAELTDSPEPVAVTDDHRRWRVSVPAGGQATFRFAERRLISRQEQTRSITDPQLQDFFARRLLDQAAYDRLRELLAAGRQQEQARQALSDLEVEVKRLHARQTSLRQNLSALQSTAEEAPLRSRMLSGLTETQDQLDGIANRKRDLSNQLNWLQSTIHRLLDGLTTD